MNEQQLISHIEDLGLSNKEAKVYVACLSLGPSAVQRIADQSGIKRVTTYVILESLVGLGLMSQTVKGKKTYFIAEDPSNLKRLIEKRERELDEQKHNFKQILPELEGLKSLPKDSPSVKFYDSAAGIRTILHNFIQEGRNASVQRVYGFSNLDEVYRYFPEFRTNHANPERTKAGIRSRFLYTSSEGPIMKDFDKVDNRESRWVPSDKYPVEGDFTIVGDNVMMLAFGGNHPVGVTVSSREMAQGLRVAFDLAWEAAAAYN
jgi:HTH-type transcriptional regulator, sugar sensing transcriptional regulator